MEDNVADNGSLHSEEEVQWYDIKVRRPNDLNAHRRARELQRRNVCPTEVFTSTYPQTRNNEDVKLVLKGFRGDSDQAMLSSGLTEWQASDVLCNYLITDNNTRKKERRLLELGSGLGKCGLLAHLLLQAKQEDGLNETILTDGDTNVLKILRKNVVLNTFSDEDDNISCQQLKWGKREAKTFLSQQGHDKFDIIIGSDLIYTNTTNLCPLFETVDVLLDDSQGKFILAHNEKHSVSLNWVKSAANQKNMFCEVLKQEGQIYLLCFRKLALYKVNSMAERLHYKITELESKICSLEIDKKYAEDKILKLDERCTVLRGDEDLPESILLSFDEDSLASILSFLEPQDFASLAAICKRFGAKTHQIGDEDVSLIKKIAYKIYEGASTREKEALPLYQDGYSPFFLYNELNKLRKPLMFDRLLGYIEHAGRDKSTIKPLSRHFMMKTPVAPIPMGESFRAFTAVSDHVMRSGKHYVTFTCTDLGLESDQPLWFGIVRPLEQITSNRLYFTPFCGRWVEGLRELQCPEWGESSIHSCVYEAINGQCKSTDWGFNDNEDEEIPDIPIPDVTNEDWEGMQSFERNGKIGLLLDYDEGTLTVYKDDIKLGVMKEGLSGIYCWMVTVGSRWGRSSLASDSPSLAEESTARIKIDNGQLPKDDKVSQEKRPRLL